MRTIIQVIELLTGAGILGLVILHPQLPLKAASAITNTIAGTIGLANRAEHA